MKLVPLPPAPTAPASPLRAIALVAFTLFALTSTLYALCVPAWSGRALAHFAVPLAPASAGGTALGPLRLDPAMSPVRVLLRAVYRNPPPRGASCTVTLRDARGRVVWSERRDLHSYAIGHSTRDGRGTTLVAGTFAPERAGDCTFAVAFDPVAARAVREASLEVRGGVAIVQWWLVGIGAAFALASLGVVLVAAPLSARAAAEQSHAA